MRLIAPNSLRLRLLAATVVTLALALAGAQVWLAGLFRDEVLRQLDTALVRQVDQLSARLDLDTAGQPRIDPAGLSDPRWDQPYSGLYWQIDRLGADGSRLPGVLRARSLWDTQLVLPADTLADGALHWHEAAGPQGQVLRVVERALVLPEQPHTRWRLMVAADLGETQGATKRFSGVLAASLAGLGLLLALAALAQVAVGLAPLKALQRALETLRYGRSSRLDGRFPAELQPLVQDFNGVLERHDAVLARARTQAGNLAHALKTPLAVLGNAAAAAPPGPLAQAVTEQVQVANRQVHWHLARARAAALGQPGQRTRVAPVAAGLLRVMGRVHAGRGLVVEAKDLAPDLAFAGEEQDLQEMLGNLLDNACRNARFSVTVQARRRDRHLLIDIDDDGPGIAPAQREAVLQRGVRLDESTPGSGLGLAIVVELAQRYGGTLALDANPAGGLRASLRLPAVPDPSS
jgi:signal transduction histidine kinase